MKNIRQETRPSIARRQPAAVAVLSTIAGAVALLAASSGNALAANECGLPAAQILCTASAYSSISYIAPANSAMTITLDNPNMVVSNGTVLLRQNAGTGTGDFILHAKTVASITGSTNVLSAQGLRPGSNIGVTVDSGHITSTANSSTTVQAFASLNANAVITLNGGVITNAGTTLGTGLFASASQPGGTSGNAIVTVNGGTVQTLGTGSTGVLAQVSGTTSTGAALVTLNGGTVTGVLQGIRAANAGAGLATVRVTGGMATATGPNGDGVLVVASGTGSFRADLTGGTVTGGGTFGAALHTSARNGGVINVGPGATLIAGSSGVAIRNGDANQDGIDEVGGNVTMTLGGTIQGHVLMGTGSDTLTITGGSIGGDIVADANDALTFDTGANRFVHGPAYAISDFGSITMKSGDVRVDSVLTGGTLTVNGGTLELTNVANAYTGGTFLNGGVLAISDNAQLGLASTTLAIDGGTLRGTGSFSTDRAITLGANGGTIQTDAPMTVTTGITGIGDLTKTGTSTLTLSAAQGYTGATTISDGTLALTGNGSLASSSRVIADGRFDISGIGGGTDIHRLSGTGAVNLGGNTLTLTTAGDTFAGAINGMGGLTVAGGTQTLSGLNTYTGETRLAGGATLALSGGGSVETSSRVVDDGLLDLSAVTARQARIRSLAGSGAVSLGGTSLSLTQANDNFGGVISGSGGLTLASGTQTLSGVNAYTGETTIASESTLALAGNGAIAESSRVAVDGRFDVSGTTSGASIRSLAGVGTVDLGKRTLTLTAAADSFQGTISGTGGLRVTGGTEVLTGTNTYTGGTTIQGGTLQLGNGGTTGSITGAVVNDGTLVFHRSDAVDFGGAISGAGTIRQIGSGLTRLTADSSGFTGTTRVEAGTLAVDGTIGGSMQVLVGARLQGNGTVGALNVAGTVAPGNSIGALRVAGDFAQVGGSVYQVEVDPNSTRSDQLLITGKATLAGGSQLNIVRTDPSAAYRLNTRYTVLTADGGLTGSYLLTGDTRSAFIKLVDQYDANHVYLVAEQVREFSEVAQTPNQIAVGGALDQSTETNDLLTAIGWLPDEASARDAFDQLSGEIHATLQTALIEDSRFVREASLARLRTDDCGMSLSRAARVPSGTSHARCGDDASGLNTWAQLIGATGHVDTDGNAHRVKRRLSGFLFGGDARVGENWRVGGLAGFQRSDLDLRDDDAQVDQYHVGAYAGWQSGPNALRFGVSHTWSTAQVTRSVRFAGFADVLSAAQDSRVLQVFGEAARSVDTGLLTLEPFANLAYVQVHGNALSEQGGLAALRASGADTSVGLATGGLRLSREVNAQTRLQAQLGWRRAFGDTTPTRALRFADDTRFQVRGLPIARDAATLEVGAETAWRPGATLSMVYSGQYAGSMEDHGVRLRASWVF